MHGLVGITRRQGDEILAKGQLYSLHVLVQVKSIMRISSLYGCNCDINDYVWRENRELLTNMAELPVIQLRFGDTG